MEHLLPVATYLIGIVTGMVACIPFLMDRDHREKMELSETKALVLETHALIRSDKEQAERMLTAIREFVALWNYGAKDEAVDVLEAAHVPVVKTGDNDGQEASRH